MQATTFELTATDGAAIHTHRWEPAGSVRGAVQIVHGLAEHAARYAHVAEVFTDAGYAVYADDHRGHGGTCGDEDDLGFAGDRNGWRRMVDDLHELSGRVREDHPDAPLVLFGHSMGSALARHYLARWPDELDGLILSGVMGGGGTLARVGALVARIERLRLGPRGRSTLLDQLAFGAYNKAFDDPRTDKDWLSRDPEVVDAYVEDPRCGFLVTTQLWIDLLDALPQMDRPEDLQRVADDLPIHIVAGTRDPVGGNAKDPRAIVERYRAAGLVRVSHRFYEDARHEVVNEINRDDVLSDLVEWLDTEVVTSAIP